MLGCELLDGGRDKPIYCPVLQRQWNKIDDPDLTPSAQMLAELIDNREEFYDFALRLSNQHHQSFVDRPLEAETLAHFEHSAAMSIEKQQKIEASDNVSFEKFLHDYFNQNGVD